MNREQQRRNAKDQKRLAQRQKGGRQQSRPPALAPSKRSAGAVSKTVISAPGRRPWLPVWWRWAAAAAALVGLLALVFLMDPLGLRTPLPGTRVTSQGNSHVNAGDSHVAYRSDPPASGPHFPTVPRRGIYTTPFVTEYLPHFMEHAGVVVQYNASASPDVVKKLTDVVNKELDRAAGLVLLAPRPDMPCQVALTSWERITAFGPAGCQPGSVGHDLDPRSSRDVKLVTDFVERNQCAYDPERQCGGGKHGDLKFPTPKPGESTVISSLGTATAAPGTPQPATPVPTTSPARQ